ncbi:MAG: YkgJ family cysteine cluster protein [Deltaproteobacteria bacterium]|nr:YkgJ family cysteine cluster protein [Deltaproteobacteria bacterium]
MSSQNSQEIEPVELTPEARFRFRCHPGVACFNQCCAQTTIILSPYDVLRLKRHLSLTAAEFLARHTHEMVDDFSGLPLVVLTMADGTRNYCPFLTQNGCGVYADRPATCRYYPVGVGSRWTEQGLENCYVYIREDHCQGFQEEGDWTLDSWRRAQGLDGYEEMDREWKAIMLQVGARPGKPISSRFGEHFLQAAYNLDWFRSFVFDTDFLKVFAVEPELEARLKADEEQLLRFAFRYLRYMLRLDGALTVKMPRGCPASQGPEEER